MASPLWSPLFPNKAGFYPSALATVAAMPQGLRTPPRLELLDWAFPSGFTIARQCGMDRRSKRDPLLRAMERARFANPESAAPETTERRRSRRYGASRDPPLLLALVIEAEWRKRAPGRGSGAAESAARRATPYLSMFPFTQCNHFVSVAPKPN